MQTVVAVGSQIALADYSLYGIPRPVRNFRSIVEIGNIRVVSARRDDAAQHDCSFLTQDRPLRAEGSVNISCNITRSDCLADIGVVPLAAAHVREYGMGGAVVAEGRVHHGDELRS